MNANIPAWAATAVMLGIGIVLSVAIILLVKLRRAHKKLYTHWLNEMEQKNNAMHELVKSVALARNERDDARSQCDRLNMENAKLDAQVKTLTDLVAQLNAENAELQKSADNATVQIEEVAPLVPLRRATRRTKKANTGETTPQ